MNNQGNKIVQKKHEKSPDNKGMEGCDLIIENSRLQYWKNKDTQKSLQELDENSQR